MREIELEYGLEEVAPSREAERRAPTQAEIELTLRTGEPSTRQQLQALCAGAARDCDSFTTYVERLEAVGVEVIPTVQQHGAKLSGLQYCLDGVTMKGSDLGKATPPAVSSNGGSAMSKTETARQLNAAATAQRLSTVAAQIETLRQAKQQSAEELAATLEPLAQAMATLVDETRRA